MKSNLSAHRVIASHPRHFRSKVHKFNPHHSKLVIPNSSVAQLDETRITHSVNKFGGRDSLSKKVP